MGLLIRDVKIIKGAAHKNDLKNATSKNTLQCNTVFFRNRSNTWSEQGRSVQGKIIEQIVFHDAGDL